MATDRFHIIVQNYKRLSSFINNFFRIHSLDLKRDRIYIFDCSPESIWKSELETANTLCSYGLEWENNLFFVRRRNWGMNLGGHLDYFRSLWSGKIPKPQYVAFMQEHFLDQDNYVKEDTLPANSRYDLDQIEEKFLSDIKIGCVFHARYGVRVATSNPIIEGSREFFGDGEILIDRAVRRGFLVDGGNFIVRPELYLKWFAANPKYLTTGDGSYGFTIVWEARLGKILYDLNIKWCDLSRNLEYTTITELDLLEKNLSNKVSKLWYDHRIWYFFYGRDQQFYWPLPKRSFVRYLKIYLENQNTYPRDTTLTFEKP